MFKKQLFKLSLMECFCSQSVDHGNYLMAPVNPVGLSILLGDRYVIYIWRIIFQNHVNADVMQLKYI